MELHYSNDDMTKVKKFSTANIRKISGGRDPIRLLQEFISQQGFDPDECLQAKTGEGIRWMLTVAEGEDLEILVEQMKKPSETTVYMGINVAAVPIRGAHDVLISALEIADGLVGIKVSLVGHFLVLSATMSLAGLSVEDLSYRYKLISAQQSWFRTALAEELGWEELPAK